MLILKYIISTALAVLMTVVSPTASAFEPTGESFPAEFEMTSWRSDSNSSYMTAQGVVGEGYGKVYLNYAFTSNSPDSMKGNFSGNLRSINNDGVLVAATLQGIWKREGKMVVMYTLDGFSNGDMIYAQGKVDLVEGTLSFIAYPIQ